MSGVTPSHLSLPPPHRTLSHPIARSCMIPAFRPAALSGGGLPARPHVCRLVLLSIHLPMQVNHNSHSPPPHPARAPPPLSVQLFALRPYRHDDMELLVLAPSAPVGCQLGRFDAAPPDVCVRAQWLCCHVGTGHLLQTSRVFVVAYVRSVVDPWTHRVSAAGSSKPSLTETKAHVCRYGAAPRDEWCLFQAPTVIEFDDACKQ